MRDLPTSEESSWIIEQLADLIARAGADSFLSAPILEPTPQCFPDRWWPDIEGVRTQIRRLLAYAGLSHLNADVSLFEIPRWEDPLRQVLPGYSSAETHAGPAALFTGIEDGICHFGVNVDQLDDAPGVMGVLAHEVTHVWRRVHGLEDPDHGVEEYLTDLTTVYLGFGVLTANTSYRYQQEGGGMGVLSWTRTSHRHAGYLPTPALCYALAVQCVARGDDLPRVRRQLGPNQAGYFDAACRAPDLDAGIANLHLPPVTQWPPLLEADPPPLPRQLLPAQQAIMELAESLDQESRSGRFHLVEPRRCALELWRCRRHTIAHWGGPEGAGAFAARLDLYEVPEAAYQLLVIERLGPTGEATIHGLLPDRVARDRTSLRQVLKEMLRAPERGSSLFASTPSYFAHASSSVLHDDDLRDLVWPLIASHEVREAYPSPSHWWQAVTDPDQIRSGIADVVSWWHRRAAELEPGSSEEQTGATP